MIEFAYQFARKVHIGLMTRKAAVAGLQTQFGVPESSAGTVLHVYGCLRNGERFTRRLNNDHLAHFLRRILEDEGVEGLEPALESVRSHIQYFEALSNSHCIGYRLLVDAYSAPLEIAPIELEVLDADFRSKVAKSLEDSSEARQARLRDAKKVPFRRALVVLAFKRNPDVVAEVFYRAKGKCGKCRKGAPFLRADGTPYLEVHHRLPLAQGGEDTIENAIALCPNCHRESHYGKKGETLPSSDTPLSPAWLKH